MLKNLQKDYQLKEVIRESFHSTTYYAITASGLACNVRVFRASSMRPSEIINFKQEYDSIIRLEPEGIIKVNEIGLFHGKPAVVTDFYEPFFLSDFMAGGKIDVSDFFPIAVRLAEIISRIHKNNILCLDIRPGNIVYGGNTVHIVDTGSSVFLTAKNEHIYHHEIIKESLPYISPEQTGRMNRSVDYRSDLYSLGIVFYEMLTGRPPFTSEDPVEILHFHIARNTLPPCDLDETIPGVLSDIVLKLIEKSPEERYQNASGLLADLTRCLNQFESEGAVENFTIGLEDFSPGLKVPDIVVGRRDELETLSDVFHRTVSQYHMPGEEKKGTELVLVSGAAGCGKSFLINEIRKLAAGSNVFFISGKHHEFRRNIPYSAIIESLRGMLRQMLSGSGERISRWAALIREALGDNGKVICDMIPELELLIGGQPPVPELGAGASVNRLNLVFVRFISALVSMKHGLVLFLDDVQWMDGASVNLLANLLRNGNVSNLMIILSCRAEGGGECFPGEILGEAFEAEIPVTRINVKSLDLQETIFYTGRFVPIGENDSRLLGEIMYRKTGGNPFYINQLMKSLYERGALFHESGRGWRLDYGLLDESGIPDDVVSLLAGRIEGMGAEAKKILAVCSCIGFAFDPETAAAMEGIPIADVLGVIKQGVDQGILQFIRNNYEFAHDRIHEVVYSFIHEEERAGIHLKAARVMLAATPEMDVEKAVDRIVNQFDKALRAVTSADERIVIAKLYLVAANKAIGSAAYDSSLAYIKKSLELSGDNIWDNDYPFAVSQHLTAARAAFLAADFVYMDKVAGDSLKRMTTLMDRIFIHQLIIQGHHACNRMKMGLREGFHVLKLLDKPLPKRPGMIHFTAGMIKINFLLRGRSIESLLSMSEMTDPGIAAALNTINNMGISAYKSSPMLLPLIVFRGVEFSVKYGHAPETAYCFAGYGMILCGALGDIERGAEYGKLALELSERPVAKKYRARTLHVIYCMIWHWKNHLRDTLERIMYAYRSAMETGDVQDATSSASMYCSYRYMCGSGLVDLKDEILRYEGVVIKFRQESNLNYLRIIRQAVINLTEKSADPCMLCGDAYDEKVMLPVESRAGDRTGTAIAYINKMILCCVFGRYDEAVACSDVAGENLDSVTGLAFIPVYYFYDSLARLAVYEDASPALRRKILKRIKGNQKRMLQWSLSAPMNHRHKHDLVEAERLRVTGDFTGAMKYYERAINGAVGNEYFQEAAMACECSARCCLSLGLERAAFVYLGMARGMYEKWGASAKTEQMDSAYSGFSDGQLYNDDSPFSTDGLTSPLTVADNGAGLSLDYSVLINALHSISAEIVLDRFIDNLMRLIVETAGAARGVFIVNRNEDLFIAAEGFVDKDITIERKSVSLSDYSGLPMSVINYSRRSGEVVVLGDAQAGCDFSDDEYLSVSKSRSVLCIPLVHQQKIKGLIYLENNLAADVFRFERVEIIKLLSTQAAISLENAMLFERAVAAEGEIQEQYEEMQSQFEEMEAMNEEIHSAYENLDSANRRLEEESRMLRESEERYRILVETMNDGLCVLDNDGVFTYLNKSLCNMLGYTEIELTGRKMSEFLDDKNRIVFEKEFIRRKEGDNSTYELQWMKRNGDVLSTIVSPKPVYDSSGEITASFGVVTNISDRIKAEKEKERIQAQLLHSQKMEAIGTLAGGIAHDFNNMLTSIFGNSDLLMMNMNEDDPAYALVREIAQAAEKSAALTRQLLTFSRKQILEKSCVDLNAVILEMEKILRRLIGEDIDLSVKLDTGAEVINADKSRIEQIILNLVVNARDAMPDGGKLQIVTSMAEIDDRFCSLIPESREGKFTVLSIEDSGAGMDNKLIKNIFEPFFTTKEKNRGTGLGLSVVYGIVKQHDGWINVKSSIGEGSVFSVYLPVAGSSCVNKQFEIKEKRFHDERRGKGERILLVEDQEDVRKFVKNALTGFGYTVFEAPDIRSAISLFLQERGCFELLLSDIVLPDGKGIFLADNLLEKNPGLKIILSSGYTEQKFQLKIISEKHYNFLPKPYSLNTLLDMVKSVITGSGE